MSSQIEESSMHDDGPPSSNDVEKLPGGLGMIEGSRRKVEGRKDDLIFRRVLLRCTELTVDFSRACFRPARKYYAVLAK